MTTISPAPPSKWALFRHSVVAGFRRASAWLWRGFKDLWEFFAPYALVLGAILLFALLSHLDDPELKTPLSIVRVVVIMTGLWGVDLAAKRAQAKANANYADKLFDFVIEDRDASISVVTTTSPELLALKDAIPGFLVGHAALQKEVIELRAKVKADE
jgi:hypothetical protein